MKNVSSSGKNSGSLLILLSGILWGTIGIYTTFLKAAGLDSISITAVRSLLTAFMLLIVVLIKGPGLIRVRFKDLWMFFGMGVISFAFFNICYFKSMEYNSLGVAGILLYTAPIFVLILSAVVFREKITLKKLICLCLAIGGCLLVSGLGAANGMGIVYGVLSGFGYALYSIFSTFALKKYNFFTAIFYAFLFSAVCLFPFANWGVVTSGIGDFKVLAALLGIAFFTTVLPYILYTAGLKKVPAGEASVIACIEPLVALGVGYFAFSQSVNLLQGLGAALILAAVIILSLKKS